MLSWKIGKNWHLKDNWQEFKKMPSNSRFSKILARSAWKCKILAIIFANQRYQSCVCLVWTLYDFWLDRSRVKIESIDKCRAPKWNKFRFFFKISLVIKVHLPLVFFRKKQVVKMSSTWQFSWNLKTTSANQFQTIKCNYILHSKTFLWLGVRVHQNYLVAATQFGHHL